MKPLRMMSAVCLMLAFPFAALAYETITVKEGGKISGTITLNGKPGKLSEAQFPSDLNAEDRTFCHGKRPLVTPFYVVDDKNRLKNVAVWLEGVTKGKKREKKMGSLVNADCRFLPHVQTLDRGASVMVENHDPILHTTHPIFQETKVTAFNIGMPRKGQKSKKKIRQAGVMKVQCDSGHVWMRAWVHSFKHPYHTVTSSDGAFVIDGVPPGTYTLKIWHESAGTVTRSVKVGPSANVEVNFTMDAK